MARELNKLSAAFVKSAPTGKHADGGGHAVVDQMLPNGLPDLADKRCVSEHPWIEGGIVELARLCNVDAPVNEKLSELAMNPKCVTAEALLREIR